MPNPLSDARGELAKLLADNGIDAYTVAPDHPTADDDADEETPEDETDTPTAPSPYPFAYVIAGDPFVSFTEGGPFGSALVRLDIALLTETGDNTSKADQLDNLILEALAIVAASDDYDALTVTQPGELTIDNEEHLGVTITTVTTVQLPG